MDNNLFETVKNALQPCLDMVLSDLLPGGRVQGNEYVCGNTQGGPGDSCKTNLKTGVGSDFASGEKWGDVISLAAIIDGCSQSEAARNLSDKYGINIDSHNQGKPEKKRQNDKVFVPVMPIPENAPRIPGYYRLHTSWTYRDANGKALFVTVRMDRARGGKDFIPLCFCRDAAGGHQWRKIAPPAPRPLYGLDRLAKTNQDVPVLLVEGEKSADAAALLFPDHVCMTWMGGSNAPGNADLSPLAGRTVTIWPDNDAPGMKAAIALADALHKGKVLDVRLVFPPDCLPKKWDLADPAPNGFDPRGELANTISRDEFFHAMRSRYGDAEIRAATLEQMAKAEDDFELTPWPMLSKKALPGFIGEFVDLATRDSEADPVAVLGTLFVRFCAEVYGHGDDKGPFVQVGEDQHPPRVFMVLCGSSAKARKGTSNKPVLRLFGRDLCDVSELSALDLPPPARESGGPLSSGEGLAHSLRDDAQDDKKGPHRDPDDKRLCIVDEEFASGLTCTKREGNTLSMAIRTFWDGGDYSPLTKNNPLVVTGAHICILTHVTMPELETLLSSVNMVNGFGNRFIWLAVKRRGLVANPAPMPLAEIIELQRRLWRLVAKAQKLREVKLTDAAMAYWEEIYPELARDHTGRIGPIVNRAEAQTKRLALVYALLDGREKIDTHHIEAALALWQYAYDSAAFIFGGRAMDPVERKVLSMLESGPCTATELSNALCRHVTRDRLRTIIGQLEAANQITVTREASGGRPRSVIELYRKEKAPLCE